MSLALRLADTPPLLRQVLVSGRVSDTLTGAGLDASIVIDWRIEAPDTEFQPLPGVMKIAGDGHYAQHLHPRQVPTVDPADQVRLRVRASIPGRDDLEVEQLTPGADWAIVDRTTATSGGDVDWRGLAAPPVVRIDLTSAPRAVALEGHVFLDHDPATPADGADVTITTPASAVAAVTDGQGFFRLDPLPVAATVTLSIVRGLSSATVFHRPDYRTRTNRAVFNLNS